MVCGPALADWLSNPSECIRKECMSSRAGPRRFSGCMQPSPLLTKKAVVSGEDGDVSVFINFVHFVLCDVTLQFCLLEEVMTALSSWSPSLSPRHAPCLAVYFVCYCELPFFSAFYLLPRPLRVFLSPCTSLTGTIRLGCFFKSVLTASAF